MIQRASALSEAGNKGRRQHLEICALRKQYFIGKAILKKMSLDLKWNLSISMSKLGFLQIVVRALIKKVTYIFNFLWERKKSKNKTKQSLEFIAEKKKSRPI